jgi:hypothetical protein
MYVKYIKIKHVETSKLNMIQLRDQSLEIEGKCDVVWTAFYGNLNRIYIVTLGSVISFALFMKVAKTRHKFSIVNIQPLFLYYNL